MQETNDLLSAHIVATWLRLLNSNPVEHDWLIERCDRNSYYFPCTPGKNLFCSGVMEANSRKKTKGSEWIGDIWKIGTWAVLGESWRGYAQVRTSQKQQKRLHRT